MVERPAALNLADVAGAREAGVTDAALGDAAQICAAFTVLNKLADAFGWDILSEETYAERAASSLERGYLVSEDLLE